MSPTQFKYLADGDLAEHIAEHSSDSECPIAIHCTKNQVF